MTVRGRDRKTLRNYFRGGSLPTAEHFGEFIDSTVNKVDDGFDKTPADGLKVAWLSAPNFLSFYRGDVFGGAVWRVAHDPDRDDLLVRKDDADSPSLAIGGEAVGVRRASPRAALDVGGVVRAEGRAGDDAFGGVLANGEWHAVTDWLTGCQVLEVTAGVGGGQRSGRYALVHAIAMNAYNPVGVWPDLFGRRRPIRTLHAAYTRNGDRILLRWKTNPAHRREYRLELRSRCRFEGQVYIHSHVSRLWFDPNMAGSTTPTPAARMEVGGLTPMGEPTAPTSSAASDARRRRGSGRREL